MLEDPRNIPTEIPLDEDAKALEAVFEFAFHPLRDPVDVFKKVEDARIILTFCCKYDAPGLLNLLHLALPTLIPRDPLESFSIACELQAEAICKAAMKDPGFSKVKYPCLQLSFCRDLNKEGLRAVHCAVHKYAQEHGSTYYWRGISEVFRLPVPLAS